MIEIKNLCFSYGNEEVLSHINLDYESSSFLGITGNNGGGKSTLLKIILGLIDCKEGITRKIALSQIGYVPQHISSNPNFPIRVFDLVLMGRTRSFGFYNKEDRTKTQEALQKLNISHLAELKFDCLSGGQKQKVLIARALCSDSKLLILDEPTAHIDADSRLEIFELLSTLHKNGIGIIVVCHDLELLLSYANQIAYLQTKLSLFAIPSQRDKLLERFACKHHLKGNCNV